MLAMIRLRGNVAPSLHPAIPIVFRTGYPGGGARGIQRKQLCEASVCVNLVRGEIPIPGADSAAGLERKREPLLALFQRGQGAGAFDRVPRLLANILCERDLLVTREPQSG